MCSVGLEPVMYRLCHESESRGHLFGEGGSASVGRKWRVDQTAPPPWTAPIHQPLTDGPPDPTRPASAVNLRSDWSWLGLTFHLFNLHTIISKDKYHINTTFTYKYQSKTRLRLKFRNGTKRFYEGSKTLPQMRREVLFQKDRNRRMGLLTLPFPQCLSAGCHVMYCQWGPSMR